MAMVGQQQRVRTAPQPHVTRECFQVVLDFCAVHTVAFIIGTVPRGWQNMHATANGAQGSFFLTHWQIQVPLHAQITRNKIRRGDFGRDKFHRPEGLPLDRHFDLDDHIVGRVVLGTPTDGIMAVEAVSPNLAWRADRGDVGIRPAEVTLAPLHHFFNAGVGEFNFLLSWGHTFF
jgi:hypothetical protein